MPNMELKPNCGSDRAWVWNTTADFADGECKQELLAIRFGNAESKLPINKLYIFSWLNILSALAFAIATFQIPLLIVWLMWKTIFSVEFANLFFLSRCSEI